MGKRDAEFRRPMLLRRTCLGSRYQSLVVDIKRPLSFLNFYLTTDFLSRRVSEISRQTAERCNHHFFSAALKKSLSSRQIQLSGHLSARKSSLRHSSPMSLRLSTIALVLPSAMAFAPAVLPRRTLTTSSSHAASSYRISLPVMEAGDHWDLERLRSSIASNSNARFGSAEELLAQNKDAWVLLFNPGQHDEGVYTLQCKSDPKTYMVAFECNEEADRFAWLLQAEGFDLARPTPWESTRVVSFCDAAGFEVSYVPQGTLFTPPSENGRDDRAYQEIRSDYNPNMASQHGSFESDASQHGRFQSDGAVVSGFEPRMQHPQFGAQFGHGPPPIGPRFQSDGAEVSGEIDQATFEARMRLERIWGMEDGPNPFDNFRPKGPRNFGP